MRRTSFHKMHCPIARSCERVRERSSILIWRDALHERIHRRHARRKVEAGAA